MSGEEKLKVARAAVHHVLHAICDDPRKFWLMGHGTGSYDKLTQAAAALWDKPVEELREKFVPRKEDYERYCAEKEANEKLLDYCREKNITVQRD